MSVELILSKLDKVRRRGAGKWMALCPIHNEKTPSLAITDDNGTILIHCFGCGASGTDVAGALGVDISELFPPREIDTEHHNGAKRVYFSAEQILEGVSSELTVAYLIAKESMNTQIDDITRERMLLAISRINAAINYTRRGG